MPPKTLVKKENSTPAPPYQGRQKISGSVRARDFFARVALWASLDRAVRGCVVVLKRSARRSASHTIYDGSDAV